MKKLLTFARRVFIFNDFITNLLGLAIIAAYLLNLHSIWFLIFIPLFAVSSFLSLFRKLDSIRTQIKRKKTNNFFGIVQIFADTIKFCSLFCAAIISVLFVVGIHLHSFVLIGALALAFGCNSFFSFLSWAKDLKNKGFEGIGMLLQSIIGILLVAALLITIWSSSIGWDCFLGTAFFIGLYIMIQAQMEAIINKEIKEFDLNRISIESDKTIPDLTKSKLRRKKSNLFGIGDPKTPLKLAKVNGVPGEKHTRDEVVEDMIDNDDICNKVLNFDSDS